MPITRQILLITIPVIDSPFPAANPEFIFLREVIPNISANNATINPRIGIKDEGRLMILSVRLAIANPEVGLSINMIYL
jgi:hypothetical protein